MTNEVNLLARSSMSSVLMRESNVNTLSLMNHTRMELQNVLTKILLLVLLHSWFRRSSLPPSGVMLFPPMCIQGTGLPLLLSMEIHLITIGKGRSQTSLTCAFLAALPMYSFVRRRGKRCNLTPRDVSFSAIRIVFRTGNFATQSTRRSFSAPSQFSMKVTSQATLPLLSTSSRLHYLSRLPPLA